MGRDCVDHAPESAIVHKSFELRALKAVNRRDRRLWGARKSLNVEKWWEVLKSGAMWSILRP
jgi:hypothetical protein